MKVLKKNQIFGKEDVLKKEFVAIPEWGDGSSGLFVREMTGRERDSYDNSLFDAAAAGEKLFSSDNFRAKLVAATACDENDRLVFDFSDVSILGQRSGKVIGRLYDVAKKLNGIGEKEMKEIVKNLMEGRSEDSNTD